MSLTKGNHLIITLSIVCLVIASAALLSPKTLNNFMTGLVPTASLDVSVSITHAVLNLSQLEQMDAVIVNGTNISIIVPVTYYGTANMTVSVDIPSSFIDCFGWYVNESGTIKNVTQDGLTLTWYAVKTVSPTTLHFQVPPPIIINDIAYTGDSYYERTFTVSSSFHFTNVTANISVSTNYQDYLLYLIENSTLVNKTGDYHLQVTDGWAHFYGFNLSNKTFRIQAAPNSTIVEISGGGGGGGGGGTAIVPLLNYTTNQQFFVDPNSITISTYSRGLLDAYFLIYNLRGEQRAFEIESTKVLITSIPSVVTVPAKGYQRVPILMNTERFVPGVYKDYITVRSDNKEEKVSVEVQLLEMQEATKAPSMEQPAPIRSPGQGTEEEPEEGYGQYALSRDKIIPYKAIGSSLIILAIIGGVVLMHWRSRHRIKRLKRIKSFK